MEESQNVFRFTIVYDLYNPFIRNTKNEFSEDSFYQVPVEMSISLFQNDTDAKSHDS